MNRSIIKKIGLVVCISIGIQSMTMQAIDDFTKNVAYTVIGLIGVAAAIGIVTLKYCYKKEPITEIKKETPQEECVAQSISTPAKPVEEIKSTTSNHSISEQSTEKTERKITIQPIVQKPVSESTQQLATPSKPINQPTLRREPLNKNPSSNPVKNDTPTPIVAKVVTVNTFNTNDAFEKYGSSHNLFN